MHHRKSCGIEEIAILPKSSWPLRNRRFPIIWTLEREKIHGISDCNDRRSTKHLLSKLKLSMNLFNDL